MLFAFQADRPHTLSDPGNTEVFRASSQFVPAETDLRKKPLGSPVCMQLCNL